jgi:OmcA/MtrC family decaheme c-type cytochrome
VKYFELSSKSRPSSHWIKFAAASLIAVAIAGCGGGGTGANTTVASNPAAVSKMAAASWLDLKPQIDPTSISVSIPADGKPVVTFKVTDELGNPVVGLGGQSKASTALVPTNFNIAFTLAKLVPANATTGDPSKWVSYLITKLGTVAAPATVGTYPTSDANGTLVDNNDGTYRYTFYRDVTKAAAFAATLADIAASGKFVADLGTQAELTYDAAATHRLGIIINGNQPGTGTATPTAVQTLIPVPLVNTFNIGFDFVPNGSAVVATRDIVTKDSCTECHDGRAIGHISTNNGAVAGVNNAPATVAANNGIPAGNFVGRNDPRLCVTCHTDQTKYGYVEVTKTVAANGFDTNYTSSYGRVNGQAAFTYPRMVHQFHMGNKLTKTGYNLNAHCNDARDKSGLYSAAKATANTAACFNVVGFPQSPANCAKCHDGNATKSDGTVNTKKTKDGNNWMTKPSIIACGSCHDGIDFATGAGFTVADKRLGKTTPTGHLAGALLGKTNDTCATCHAAGGSLVSSSNAEISLVHRTTDSTVNNAIAAAGVANFAYDIKSVTVNTSGQPVITFQIKKDGVAVTAFNVPTPVVNGANGQTVISSSFEPITGFAGGPSLYAAYAVPQDGIAAPADFNAYQSVSLTNLLVASGSPKAGSITGPDASGYFTATLTGDLLGQAIGTGCAKPATGVKATCVNTVVLASPIVIPATAKMVTGAIIGVFTQKNQPSATGAAYVAADPTVNLNVSATGGLRRPAVLKKLVATGYTARRVIVDVAKCNSCHEQLGTDPAFHSQDRNDPTACAICHNANKTSNGWAANANTFIHGVHGASKRTVGFTWAGTSATDNFSMAGYPGLLKDCNQCHLPNTVNFGNTGGATVASSLLWPTVGAATYNSTTSDPTNAAFKAWSSTFRNSPYVTGTGSTYGNVFSFAPVGSTVLAYTTTAGTAVAAHVAGTGGEFVAADPATLVSSPISAACFSCHDSAAAKNHVTSNGGAVYATRASVSTAGVLNNREDCLTCHGVGRVADVAIIHK